tara:strand:- start:3585 stop:4766 length:1182 start_codon:yes stop_codon:yes gene_type:complete
MSRISDSAAVNKYGVGPAGEGRHWDLAGSELRLVAGGAVIYRKPVTTTTEGTLEDVQIAQEPAPPPAADMPFLPKQPVVAPRVPRPSAVPERQVAKPSLGIAARRFEATPPTIPQSRMERGAASGVPQGPRRAGATGMDEGPMVPGRATLAQDPVTALKADAPEVAKLQAPDIVQPKPQILKRLKGEAKVLKKLISESAKQVGIEATKKADTALAVGESVAVTTQALKDVSKPSGEYSLVIDPNTNIASLLDGDGKEVKTFPVGTGDITGTQYGKPFYTPQGNFEIINKANYEVWGSFGPTWLGLGGEDIEGKELRRGAYGLHGPHKKSQLREDKEGFINKGYVSHGCVRFRIKDIQELSEIFDLGMSVRIKSYNPSLEAPHVPKKTAAAINY